VVDDERIIRVALADDLRDTDYEVYEFSNASAALMEIKNILPDVVITDLKMPDINGIEFLKRIKEIKKTPT
jgi:CheY-like chemotaxis protein